jgi:hypothetical protein
MTTTTVLDYLLSFTSNLPPEKTVLPLLSLHTPENFTCAPGRLGPLKINQAREQFEFFFKKNHPALQVAVPTKGKFF